MRRIRILLAGMPPMLLDMITDIVALHAGMMVAGTMQDTDGPPRGGEEDQG